MREKVVHTKMAKECSRQKEEQVRSPEAGTSSEHSRETEGGLCHWRGGECGGVVGNERRGIRSFKTS